jgi:hypothetical protein
MSIFSFLGAVRVQKTKLKNTVRNGTIQKTKKKTTNIIVLVELVSGDGFIYARKILSKFRPLVNEKSYF